jgi:hypothetical protein
MAGWAKREGESYSRTDGKGGLERCAGTVGYRGGDRLGRSFA